MVLSIFIVYIPSIMTASIYMYHSRRWTFSCRPCSNALKCSRSRIWLSSTISSKHGNFFRDHVSKNNVRIKTHESTFAYSTSRKREQYPAAKNMIAFKNWYPFLDTLRGLLTWRKYMYEAADRLTKALVQKRAVFQNRNIRMKTSESMRAYSTSRKKEQYPILLLTLSQCTFRIKTFPIQLHLSSLYHC